MKRLFGLLLVVTAISGCSTGSFYVDTATPDGVGICFGVAAETRGAVARSESNE